MNEFKANIFSIFGMATFVTLFLGLSGCVKQEASKVEDVKTPLATTSVSDAEIAAAQKVIEKLPNAPNGYNKLAVAYIRRARESGDFSLNANAQIAVDRALEIDPQNYDAQKLKASLFLTFHRFAEGLEYGKKLQEKNTFSYYATSGILKTLILKAETFLTCL